MPGTSQPRGSVISNLPPASFSFVMATGIVSVGLDDFGAGIPALILFVVAVIGGVILTMMTIVKAFRCPHQLMADVRNPGRAFGFFTIVAAANVIGTHAEGYSSVGVGVVLALISAVVWLVLNYALPALLLAGQRRRPIMTEMDGSWFLWVVGTQSIALAAAVTYRAGSPMLIADLAVGLWGVGVMLYMIIATLVTIRLISFPLDLAKLSPTYWIYMGATAISVLAGSIILRLPQSVPVIAATRQVVSGASFVLWALGLWWIPLLIIFGVFRHFLHRRKLSYELGLWSIVFPLGMYASASMQFGRVEGITSLDAFGRIFIWVALAAWLASSAAMVSAALGWARRRRALRSAFDAGSLA